MDKTETQFLDPEKIFEQIGLQQGWKCADFGCGGGHFSLEMARKVGESGKVYAFDILPSALEAIESYVKVENIQNIVTKRVNLENEKGSGLDDGILDLVVVKDVLFQNKEKESIMKEVHRVLKEKGKALVIEWNPDSAEIGPEASMRISQEDVEKLIQESGLKIEKKLNVGDYHNAFVMSK